MAALMIQVPEEIARVLHEIPVPGNPEKADTHITVIYLGDAVPIEQIGSMLPAIYKITSETLPFLVSTKTISNFPMGDDGKPIVARIDSPALHDLRSKLCKALDKAGVSYSKKFPDYKPHVTLAYDLNSKTSLSLEIPKISWGVSELVLWGADRGVGRLRVKFPFSLLKPKEEILADYQKIAVRIATLKARRQLIF